MTWLHLSVAVMAITACYTAHRGGLCFGCAAVFLEDNGVAGLATRKRRLMAVRCLAEGYGYALLTVLLAGGAGFIAGGVL